MDSRTRRADVDRLGLPRRVSSALLLSLVVCLHCGGGDENGGGGGGGDPDGGPGSGGSGGAATGGAGGSAAGGGTSTGGGFNSSGGSGGGAGDGGFEECAGDESRAEGLRLDMYVMLDHTASMGNDCPLSLIDPPSENTKWCFATHALAQFFTSQSAQGHRAALQFMALPNYACGGGPDNPEATPRVPLTALPVDASHELITALDEDDPVGGLGTPIEAGLRGIATFTAANVTPGRTMIGILITDGEPNRCSGSNGVLASVVADHLAETGIRTFIIGMTGASSQNLEAMAAAGGAPEHGPEFCDPEEHETCHYWSVRDGDPVAFVNALEQISDAALIPCEYVIPDPPNGQELDLNLVNVIFGESADGKPEYLRRVDDLAACDPNEGGWYFDDLDAPKSIRLCERSCQEATAAGAGASLRVSYGCLTQPPIIE